MKHWWKVFIFILICWIEIYYGIAWPPTSPVLTFQYIQIFSPVANFTHTTKFGTNFHGVTVTQKTVFFFFKGSLCLTFSFSKWNILHDWWDCTWPEKTHQNMAATLTIDIFHCDKSVLSKWIHFIDLPVIHYQVRDSVHVYNSVEYFGRAFSSLWLGIVVNESKLCRQSFLLI